MCGRTSLAVTEAVLADYLLRWGVTEDPPWYRPRHNVAPSQDQVVLVEREHVRHVRPMRWGLIPRWANDPSIGQRMINARAETVGEKPAYRDALSKRRGLVVVDSYYEWKREPTGPKTPFRIHRVDGAPFLLAALWESWDGNSAGPLETCTVITTRADAFMAPVHHRMPVIVRDSDVDAWLSRETSPVAVGAILAREADGLASYPVSQYVNAPSNDGEECWRAVAH